MPTDPAAPGLISEVPAFFKQVGSNRGPDWAAGITRKGDDPAQWPHELREQEFPDG